ncbi:DNA repair protein RecN [Rhodanobacter sp. FW510-R12]|uniref:DNA repair protein RecN n=1 Tax=unclassified Rhodanobacter TaxID=2621553 RepID=UPI0007A9F6A9|nr:MULTISPECIES: DNA repair protein RecN [unclassified Rhodanobacter]KZC18362.1 DNA repair protein RecN [Rhodanobacter sp. FW104-R8]KZC29027.1 DNA repair protein RecN [Rhodanobacter sp. FW510-T8]KZC30128.1 DNA repair protein RecN [Rhodanobacter sp. FW510-R10]
MLTSLYVRHFAVVEAAEVAFGPGLTVVSGETGAGKSLLVDALMLLAGARADSGMVRAGSDRAELAAEFDLAELPEARQWLRREELDEDGGCQLRRVIRAEGSSKAWINGRPANARQLGELAALLVEIHGQHEHQALLSRPHQLALLDAYAGHDDLLARVRDSAVQWRELGARMRKLSGGDDRDRRIEMLRHELGELEQWALPPAELDELEASHKRLANAGRLAEGTAGVVELLDGDSEFALRRALGRAHAELGKLAAIDGKLAPLLELLDNAGIELGEAADGLVRYAQDVDLDPERYAEVDQHLARLHELSRRHRLPLAELHDRLDALRLELGELEGAGDALEKLAAQRQRLQHDYTAAATQLSEARADAAARLGEEVSALMAELGMAGGVLRIELEAAGGDEPDPQGRERCELLVSANPGQPPRLLRKVASGGELARISLAIEVATLGKDTVGCMIFDEVDTGIGGAVAEVVGQKLRALGARRQVLCVTHLPQVAAQGHAHLKVSKHSDGDSTRTRIERLDAGGRRDELARMLGGVEITRETRAHAKQMLDRAQTA